MVSVDLQLTGAGKQEWPGLDQHICNIFDHVCQLAWLLIFLVYTTEIIVQVSCLFTFVFKSTTPAFTNVKHSWSFDQHDLQCGFEALVGDILKCPVPIVIIIKAKMFTAYQNFLSKGSDPYLDTYLKSAVCLYIFLKKTICVCLLFEKWNLFVYIFVSQLLVYNL